MTSLHLTQHLPFLHQLIADPGKLTLDPNKYAKSIVPYKNDELVLCDIMEFHCTVCESGSLQPVLHEQTIP